MAEQIGEIDLPTSKIIFSEGTPSADYLPHLCIKKILHYVKIYELKSEYTIH